MAAAGEEEVEYESDPEEVKRSLGMRRRDAASDDEEGDVQDAQPGMDRKAVTESDESDGQGGAGEYDEEDDEDEEYLEEEEVYDDEEEEIDKGEENGKGKIQGNGERGGEGPTEATLMNERIIDGIRNVEDTLESHDENRVGEEEEEEEKEHEPFAVPTAGAFYMHDDRFRENARGGGRQRHTHVARKLWESKDERKWGHDKYEEITVQEGHYDEGKRTSRGRYRARSRNQGADRGYPRESRSSSLNNQKQAPRAVRGRVPRRYEPAWKRGNQEPPTQSKQSGKPLAKTPQPNPTRDFQVSTSAESASVPAKKHVASSLNSASPPFFPSGSLNKDVTVTQKKNTQAATAAGNNESFPPSQANALRGKNLVDPIGMEKLNIDDSRTSANGKPLINLRMLPSGSSSISSSQASRSRVHGRGLAVPGQYTYQPVSTKNNANRVSSPAQLHSVHRSPQGWAQSSVQVLPQQVGHRPGISSQTSSPPKTATSFNSCEPGEVESSGTSKPKGVMVGKGNGNFQGAGRGSFLYGGAQVMGAAGNMSVSHGDQNFPNFLPVMQFAGQRPGGMGVPAVGMAFPGYVGQPQLGLGNSEMTWLPVLAGAAGALGASYCPPYIAVDGAYHARASGPASSTGSSSQENNLNKSNSERMSSEKPELAGDELELQQNNPNKQPRSRRYSEMSFSK